MRCPILGKELFPLTGEVFSEIRREARRRHVTMGNSIISITTENLTLITAATEIAAVVVVQKIHNGSEVKVKVWCDYCNKLQHTKETC